MHFQKTPEFSQKLPNCTLNFSDTNQNNQSRRLPVLQEEELERQKSQNVNITEHMKKHKDIVSAALPGKKELKTDVGCTINK